MEEEKKKDIMKLLGVSRWTPRCSRVAKCMQEENDFDISHYEIAYSSDYNWLFRKTRPREWIIWRIGADGVSWGLYYYVYLVKKK